MKAFNWKKFKVFLLSGVMVLATAFCAILGIALSGSFTANAEDDNKLSETEYQTDGASIRIFDKVQDENGNVEMKETERDGIRFHIETGVGYKVEGNTLINTQKRNEFNDSYVVAEGYTTYTLIIPTHLIPEGKTLDWSLSQEQDSKVMALDTTKYWFDDKEGNHESVAYVYNLPKALYTKPISFCGVILNSAGTVVAQTSVSERYLVEVAKIAYNETIIEGDSYWGSEELDEKAAPLIKKFIPTRKINYIYTDAEGTQQSYEEEVMWGESPKAPNVSINASGYIAKQPAWYNADDSEEFDVTKKLTDIVAGQQNDPITLTFVASANFGLTGVAHYGEFTYEGTKYSGIKVYATLPVLDFYTEEERATGSTRMVPLDVKALNIEHKGTGTFNGIEGVWTLLEGKGSGAQVRLVFAFNSGLQDGLQDGDRLIVKGDSIFYTHGIMYNLTEDYTIDFSLVNNEKDYGIFLGYLNNSHIKSIENWVEPTDNTRLRIRVTFYEDLLINSDFTFVYEGTLPDGYQYPVYIKTATGETTKVPGGFYHWNEGQHTILELEGYAHNHGDELFGAPGTKIVQNGGYYIFEDEMYAYFNDTDWVVGGEKGKFGANAFSAVGNNFTEGTKEIRFTTNSNAILTEGGANTDRWFDTVKQISVENMSDQPYGVYLTALDGTVTEIDNFVYHGQDISSSSYHHIFAFEGVIGTQAGETITIVSGTRFWAGSEYFTATEDIVFYYNGIRWISNSNGDANQEITASDFTGNNYNLLEVGINKVRMHFTAESFNGQMGSLMLEQGGITVNGIPYTNLMYHGNGNMIFEIIGDGSKAIGANAFTDTLVIEAGTKLWIGMENGSPNTPYCIYFPERLEWRYVEYLFDQREIEVGGLGKINGAWAIANNTDISNADIIKLSNEIHNNPNVEDEVRLKLTSGKIIDSYYGFVAMDISKGIPVVNGVEMPKKAFAYGQAHNLLAVRGGEYGSHDGDYLMIPAGSTWWTTQGSITFTEEIFYTYKDGAWVQGDLRAVANVTANNASVSGLENMVQGKTYSFTVTPESDYKVSSVTVNGKTVALTADNTYTLTAQANNEIIVKTVKGYNVTFKVDDGATINDGAITDGTIKAVANGETLTFSVAVKDGYRLKEVTNATDNGNGNYTVSSETTVTITTVKQYVVSYTIPANVTASFNGQPVSGSGSIAVETGTYTANVTANEGYILQRVTANGTSLTANNGNYSVDVNDNVELACVVIDPINVKNSMIQLAQVYTSDSKSFRIYLDETDAEIKAIAGANTNRTPMGTVNLILGGSSVTPTQYNYFGLINGIHHQCLEVVCDVGSLKSGDSLTIKKGTYFHLYDDKYIYFDEDYSFKCFAVTLTPTNATIKVETDAVSAGSFTSTTVVPEGSALSIITVSAANGYGLKSVKIAGTEKVTGATTLITDSIESLNNDVAITAEAATYTITFSCTRASVKDIQSNNTTLTQNNNKVTVPYGFGITFTAVPSNSSIESVTANKGALTEGNSNSYTYTPSKTCEDATITVTGNGGCLVEGTLITLADGTQKAVENLKAGDMLLVFNHETGKYETAPLLVNTHATAKAEWYTVISLYFSNGEVLRIADEHAVFSKTENKYVYINANNAYEFIGDEFISSVYENGEVINNVVTLDNVTIEKEYVRIFTPVSAWHMNVIADNMLTLSGRTVNFFEYDETMKYDEEKMYADIEEYGLYTYEDFADYISEEVFNAFPFKYFKVAIEKGEYTWEELMFLISEYNESDSEK